MLRRADRLLLLDVYPAGESPIKGVDSDHLFAELKHSAKSRLRASDDRVAVLRESLRSGDVLVTLGAGDVYKLGQALLAEGSR